MQRAINAGRLSCIPFHIVRARVTREHHGSGHGVAELFDGGFFELDLSTVQGDTTYAGIGLGCDGAFFLASGEQRIYGHHTGRKCCLTESSSVHR
jgi:hypothetical protein